MYQRKKRFFFCSELSASAVPARCACANGSPDLDYRWVQDGPGHSHPQPQTRLLWSACAQHQELADSNAAGCYSLQLQSSLGCVSTLPSLRCLVHCKPVSQVPNDDPCMYVAVSNPGADTSKIQNQFIVFPVFLWLFSWRKVFCSPVVSQAV